MGKEKTHWLANANKNYLGHWDLPNGKDVVLTIESAQWEEVKNPIINVSEAKRVIRFKEKDYKPFICNETNAQSILRSTKVNYMEDCGGKKIQLTVGQTKVMGQLVDCLRIKELSQDQLQPKTISKGLSDNLIKLIEKAGMDNEGFCELMKIDAITELPASKYNKVVLKLNAKIEKNGNPEL